MVIVRPTPRELHRKLAGARDAIEARQVRVVNIAKISGELAALPIRSTDEVWNLIHQLLDEIDASHYVGTRPPMRSYEPRIVGKELFAFCWESQKLKRRMYLKFCLSEGKFYYISLHESRRQS